MRWLRQPRKVCGLPVFKEAGRGNLRGRCHILWILNAILWTIFKGVSKETSFPRMIKFYGEWNDESSEMLLAMDSELRLICRQFENIGLSGGNTFVHAIMRWIQWLY